MRRLWLWWKHRPTNREFVDQIRRNLTRLDKLRGWLIAYVAAMTMLAFGIVALSIHAWSKALEQGGPESPNQIPIGFLVGAFAGGVFGFVFLLVIHMWVNVVFYESRALRLLVQYDEILRLQTDVKLPD